MPEVGQHIDALGISPLIDEFEVARITGMSVATVRTWRQHGKGPQYMKLGSAVRYRPEDLRDWINTRPVIEPIEDQLNA